MIDIIIGIFYSIMVIAFGMVHIIYFGRDKLDIAVLTVIGITIVGSFIIGCLINAGL